MLHTADPKVANTLAYKEFHRLLARGGVIGASPPARDQATDSKPR